MDAPQSPQARDAVLTTANVADGQELTMTAVSRNSANYQRFLQTVEEANPGGEIVVVTDNLSSHHSVATRAWLAGLERNAEVYASNTAVMKAADEGEIDAGVMYHYYWYRDQAENALKGDDAELHFFRNQDPGAFLSISGAGVLASSDQPEEAQRLVAYLTSPEAQQRLAESTALEYAVANGVASAEVLPPLEELEAPPVDPGSLDQQRVTELMQDVGLL